MKKIVLPITAAFLLLASCGGEETKKEEKAKTCESYNDVEITCEDAEALKEIETAVDELLNLEDTDKEAYITQAESIMAKIDPKMDAYERIVAADPLMAEEYSYTKIKSTREEISDYKQEKEDLMNMQISASWEQDPKFKDEMDVMVRYKNTSSKDINNLNGHMKYLDADGNLLCEDDVVIYAFNFNEKPGDFIPAGFEGTSDKAINCEKEKRALIDSISLTITGISYYKKD